ncbi:YsnF/AvaK domain-containing protein [Burkholderia sp. M6-3]
MDMPESAKSKSQSADRADTSDASNASDELRLAAVQEQLQVDVDRIETGSVRVRKVIQEETKPVSVTLREEHVEVRRVPIGRPVDERYAPRQEGDTLIVPVFESVPVVKMQLMLKEEVHITTFESQHEAVREFTLKSEELVIERREGTDGEWKTETDTE